MPPSIAFPYSSFYSRTTDKNDESRLHRTVGEGPKINDGYGKTIEAISRHINSTMDAGK
jgi:hypothetical protein